MVNFIDDDGLHERWISDEDLTPYEQEERERYKEIERCPGANLEQYLYWLDRMNFKNLRGHEPTAKHSLKRDARTREAIFLADEIGADWGQIETKRYVPKGFKRELNRRLNVIAAKKQEEEISLYRLYQKVSRRLFRFLDPVLGQFACPENFFRIVTPLEYGEREIPSNHAEELIRQSIAAGLAEHVAECPSCKPEYDRIVQEIARDKLNHRKRIPININLQPESSFDKGMIYATIKREVDSKLLGLYDY